MTEVIYNPPSFYNERLVMGIDQYNRYLGWVDKDDPKVVLTVNKCPPNDDPWIWSNEKQDWLQCWYITSDYKPSLSSDNAIGFTTVVPRDISYKWDQEKNTWVDPDPLNTKFLALIKEAPGIFQFILKDELPNDIKIYLTELKNLYTAIHSHLESRNLIKSKKVCEAFLAMIDSLLIESELTIEDIKAAHSQFKIYINAIT